MNDTHGRIIIWLIIAVIVIGGAIWFFKPLLPATKERTQDTSPCAFADNDKQQLCLARTTMTDTTCKTIKDSNIKARCYALVHQDASYCDTLSTDHQYFCTALATRNLDFCERITDQQLHADCFEEGLTLDTPVEDAGEPTCSALAGIGKTICDAVTSSNLDLCYSIQDNDQKNFCLGVVTADTSHCTTITSASLKEECMQRENSQ